MKIAIDARKWRDNGIGTYVRNLVRHLAQIDRETTYFLFCDRADRATLRDLAENFVPIVDGSRGYGQCGEAISFLERSLHRNPNFYFAAASASLNFSVALKYFK